MTLTFEAVRDWAIEQATTWARDPDGADRLGDAAPDAAWALRIEAFNLLLPVGAAAAGVVSDLGTTGLFGAVKRRGLDRAARAWVLRAQVLGSGNRVSDLGRRGVDALLLAEFATPSMLEPMLRVSRTLPPRAWAAAAADPRTFRAFRRQGPSLPLVLPLADERIRLRQARRVAATAWAEIRRRPPGIAIDGRDVTGPALDALEPLVLRSLPWLAVEREALARTVDGLRPRWIVVASDQHRLGRTAVGVARAIGAKALVLQHGLPQYDLGYVPVVADAVSTWSEADDAWFLDRGTPAERLIRLGNPRLDDLPGMDREAAGAAAATRLRLARRPRLLVALSPSDRSRNAALVELALGLLSAEASASLVLKLHPGDGRWADVRARVRAAGVLGSRVRIVRREPLQPLLAWADAVLLHRSTVAIEALAAGTPVIVAATGAPSPADALPADLDLPAAGTADELARTLLTLGGDAPRQAFITARRAALERSTGPLDGGAARRIARFLLEAA